VTHRICETIHILLLHLIYYLKSHTLWVGERTIHPPWTTTHTSLPTIHMPWTTVHTPWTTIHTLSTTIHTPWTTVHTPWTTIHTLSTTIHTPWTTVHTPWTTIHTLRTTIHTPWTTTHLVYHWNHPRGSCSWIQPLLSHAAWSCPDFTLYLFSSMSYLRLQMGERDSGAFRILGQYVTLVV
jgi:hypothetical protein